MNGNMNLARNEQGGVTLSLGPANVSPGASIALGREAAVQSAGAILNLLGVTGFTRNPDGTWIAR